MEELIRKIPSWLFAISLVVFVGILAHSLFVSGRPFQIFGQPFGAITEVGSPIPAGAVIAFESDCARLGPNWSRYTPATARVIVGAGDDFHPKHREWFMQLPQGGEERKQLEPYEAESSGGELEVTLTEAQMPRHRHDLSAQLLEGMRQTGSDSAIRLHREGFRDGQFGLGETAVAGENLSHNNMPPYIALYFCKKD